MNNTALKRLHKEYEMFVKDPPDNFTAKPLEVLFQIHNLE
jgi:ubiquitin-protein ligase